MRKNAVHNFRIATSVTSRDINRRLVLNLIRRHQPVSRADLSRQSGLQRSTISLITEELISQRWVIEGATYDLPRGRKPTFLHLNSQGAGIFGINVRPFLTDIALANLDGQFLVQETIPTPETAEEFVESVSARIRTLMEQRPDMAYEGIGVSLPGRIDLPTQTFVFAPNLGWILADMKEQLEAATGLSVELENEANSCVLSEFWFGKHDDSVRNLIAVAVSEGIGVGMVLNGRLIRGNDGYAGEFGHISIKADGPQCRCGNHGCWEIYASNSAALRAYRQNHAVNAAAKLGARGSALSFDDLIDLAESGDAKAIKAIEQMAEHLGTGLAMLVTGLAPDVIVVVGEITRLWSRVEPLIAAKINNISFTHAKTRIISSGPASLPRLRGIIALLLQKRFGAPAIT